MTWGWVNYQEIFIWKWTNPLTNKNNCKKEVHFSIISKRVLIAEINAVKSCIDCKQIFETHLLRPNHWNEISVLKFIPDEFLKPHGSHVEWMSIQCIHKTPVTLKLKQEWEQFLWLLQTQYISPCLNRLQLHTNSVHLWDVSHEELPQGLDNKNELRLLIALFTCMCLLYCFSAQFTKVIM